MNNIERNIKTGAGLLVTTILVGGLSGDPDQARAVEETKIDSVNVEVLSKTDINKVAKIEILDDQNFNVNINLESKSEIEDKTETDDSYDGHVPYDVFLLLKEHENNLNKEEKKPEVIPTSIPTPTPSPTPEVTPTPEIIEQGPCVVIYKGDPDKKEIALTFDDQGENLGKILEALDAAGVKGTFFLLTSEIKNNPERWQQAVANGHLICNHSTKHDMSLGSKSEEAIKADILGWEEAVVEVLGQEYLDKYKEETPYFRTPGGNKTERLLKVLGELGYKYTFYWTAEDCYSMVPEHNPDGLTKAQYYANHTKNGAIFLAHGGTWSAVDDMIANIQSKEYEIVTLDKWDDYYKTQVEN